MSAHLNCFECQAPIDAETPPQLGEALLAHARSEHDWPYPDVAIENYAEATQRLTGGSARLPEIGEIEIHAVDESLLDDWKQFFDHDAFVGNPEWASCYCLEPHVRRPGREEPDSTMRWTGVRQQMIERLRSGGSFGYLAYVDGKAAGWVNASLRGDYALYENVDPDGPEPSSVVGVSCFIVAPPYRRHGIAEALLDRVVADAADRGANWVEAYPFKEEHDEPAKNFRGPITMYTAREFETVEVRDRDTVVRRPA